MSQAVRVRRQSNPFPANVGDQIPYGRQPTARRATILNPPVESSTEHPAHVVFDQRVRSGSLSARPLRSPASALGTTNPIDDSIRSDHFNTVTSRPTDDARLTSSPEPSGPEGQQKAYRTRARSKTIQSIFDYQSFAPGGSPTNTVGRRGSVGAGSPIRRQGTVGTTNARRSSVSSIHSGGNTQVVIKVPVDESNLNRVGRVQTMLNEEEEEEEQQRESAVAQEATAATKRENQVDARSRSGSRRRSVAGEILSEEQRMSTSEQSEHHAELGEEHHDAVVDHLDIVDPTVSLMSHFQNITSGIVLPGYLVSKPVIALPDLPRTDPESRPANRTRPSNVARPSAMSVAKRTVSRAGNKIEYEAVIDHDDPLDRHVADCLTKKQKIKRGLKGLGHFLMTPLGIFVALYGLVVVFWGAALVFFLARFINFHNKYKNDYWVEISSQIINGAFTVTGVGLFPQRCLDAYRILTIWRLKNLAMKKLKKRGLYHPDHPDLFPDPAQDPSYFMSVLTKKQRATLDHHQKKFSRSQTWYRPYETDTHWAFSVRLALWNTILMVWNSLFQIMLCCCMWILSAYSGDRILLHMGTTHSRPSWTTGCLIPCSFLCGIGAAVIIWKGGQRTKKVDTVENRLRTALGIEQVSSTTSSDEPSWKQDQTEEESTFGNTDEVQGEDFSEKAQGQDRGRKIESSSSGRDELGDLERGLFPPLSQIDGQKTGIKPLGPAISEKSAV